MALSGEDQKAIVKIIKETMQNESRCGCGIGPETQEEVGHFFGRVKDLGGGNLNAGIEILSAAVNTMAKFRRTGEKIGGTVVSYFTIAFVVAIAWLLGAGIIVWLKKFISVILFGNK